MQEPMCPFREPHLPRGRAIGQDGAIAIEESGDGQRTEARSEAGGVLAQGVGAVRQEWAERAWVLRAGEAQRAVVLSLASGLAAA
ncbi:MAG: hypothetical protein D6816_11275 [Bacteroidetes bacterium]|nr:MAG: hypothetical protein D6816_11275 [Bacteroidota bacterium]